MHMVSFPKADPDKLEGREMMVRKASCGPGETMEVIDDLGLILIGKDGKVRVDDFLPGMPSSIEGMTLQKNDIITACNGTDITTATRFSELYTALGVGDKVNVNVIRGEQTIGMSFAKPEASENTMMIKRTVNK